MNLTTHGILSKEQLLRRITDILLVQLLILFPYLYPLIMIHAVQVMVGGVWGGLCDDGLTLTEADVICHQAGYRLGAEKVDR